MAAEGIDTNNGPVLEALTLQLARFHSVEKVIGHPNFDLELAGIDINDAAHVYSINNFDLFTDDNNTTELVFPELSHLGKVTVSGGKIQAHLLREDSRCSLGLNSLSLLSKQLIQRPQYLESLERTLGVSEISSNLKLSRHDLSYLPNVTKYVSFNHSSPEFSVSALPKNNIVIKKSDRLWFSPEQEFKLYNPGSSTFYVQPSSTDDFSYVTLSSPVRKHHQNVPLNYQMHLKFDDGHQLTVAAKTNHPVNVRDLINDAGLKNPKIKLIKITINGGGYFALDGLYFFSMHAFNEEEVTRRSLVPFKVKANDITQFSMMSPEEYLNQQAFLTIQDMKIPFRGTLTQTSHSSDLAVKDFLTGLVDRDAENGFLNGTDIFTLGDVSIVAGPSWTDEEWNDFISPDFWVQLTNDSLGWTIALILIALMISATIFGDKAKLLRSVETSIKLMYLWAKERSNSLAIAYWPKSLHCLFYIIASTCI